ncbi:hypothetical protein HAX54_040376, partial [Datura stramonium]|nr:hypothetical protein [Datura stramonium]
LLAGSSFRDPILLLPRQLHKVATPPPSLPVRGYLQLRVPPVKCFTHPSSSSQ